MNYPETIIKMAQIIHKQHEAMLGLRGRLWHDCPNESCREAQAMADGYDIFDRRFSGRLEDTVKCIARDTGTPLETPTQMRERLKLAAEPYGVAELIYLPDCDLLAYVDAPWEEDGEWGADIIWVQIAHDDGVELVDQPVPWEHIPAEASARIEKELRRELARVAGEAKATAVVERYESLRGFGVVGP